MEQQAYWRTRAQVLRRHINLGWWLAAWWPLAVVASVIASLLLVFARRLDVRQARFFAAFAVLQALLAIAAWLRARRRFVSEADALLSVDLAAALDCRLISAQAGVGSYPPAPTRGAPIVRWRWRRLLGPALLSTLALIVAANVPLSQRATRRAGVEPPAEWAEMGTWLGALQETALVEPEALAGWEARLASLRQQAPEQWYDHNTLEATDALKEDLASAMRSLSSGLDAAEEGLSSMSAPAQGTDAAGEGQRRMDGALSLSARAGFPMRRDLAERLRQAARSAGRTLSAEEAARLRGRLSEGAARCRSALLECRAGHRMCRSGRCARGTGSIARGPGPAPMTFALESSRAGSTAFESVNNPNLQDASLGDLVRVERGQHVVDEGGHDGAVPGGRTGAQGKGGEAVWRSNVTPEERAVLERYFR